MKEFIKKEPVLFCAALLAVISAVIVRPSVEYLSYIDYGVLILLFSLMIVVNGLQSIGVFEFMASYLLKYMKNMRQLYIVMISLCFFSSMLITNDVALITFIPFTIMILLSLNRKDKLITLIVLETIAANLGSVLTPIGNPQNLYIYTISKMTLFEFLKVMLPVTIISYIMLTVVIWLSTKENEEIALNLPINKVKDTKRLLVYLMLFALCIGAVLHFINYALLLIIICGAAVVSDKRLIKNVDYNLLITFTFFFIFIGNMQQMDVIRDFIQTVMNKNAVLFAVLSSQVISNVPAAMLLSGVTNDYTSLLLGVNIGGLGTLIASMASLISYRYYVNIKEPDSKGYIQVFTVTNVIFLIVLVVAVPFIR